MRPMPELEITIINVDELVPYANNAKLHTAEQVDQIAASIEEFGNCDPIAVWHNAEGEPEIVEGHGRLMALKKLGIKQAPIITLDHLSDEQRRAYILAHNKLNMNTGFDFAILDNELEGITNIDMSDFGFNLDGILTEDEMDEFFIEAVPRDDNDGQNQTTDTANNNHASTNTVICPHCGKSFEL